MKLFAPILLATISAVYVTESRAAEWPQIVNVDIAVGIYLNAEIIHFDLPLRDTEGRIRYRLVCRGGKESYLDRLFDTLDINYVGPLLCILNEGEAETEVSLLRETEVPPWFTRGQFRSENLVGKCAEYPDYGRVRTFRLRGFKLTLEFANLEMDAKNRVGYSIFKVTVRDDPGAISATAMPTQYPKPNLQSNNCSPETPR